MTGRDTSLGRTVAKGAAWMVAMRMTIRLLGVISMIILARLLAPEDFGLVALAMLVVGAIEVMGEFGFGHALIQNREADDRHYNTAWTLNVIRGLVSAVVLVVLAAPAAGYFAEPRLAEILYWLAVATAITGFDNIGIVDFQKGLRLDKEYRIFVFTKLASFVMTIAVAFVWRSYWALVAGILTRAVAMLALSYIMHPYRPRLDVSKTGELFRFSKWLLANEYLVFASQHFGQFLIGRFLNAASVGIYGLAKEIATLTTAELVLPMTRAIYPGYAKIQHEPDLLSRMFQDTLGLVFLLSWPMAFGIAAVAEPFTLVFLGAKWLRVAEILPYLAVGGALTFAWVNSGSLFMARGRPNLATATYALGAAVTALAMIAGYRWNGLTGIAQAAVISPLAMFPITYVMVNRVIVFKLSIYILTVWRSVAATGVMFVAVMECDALLNLSSDALRLAILVLTGALIYVGLVAIFWWASGKPAGAESQVISVIREIFVAKHGRRAALSGR